MEATMAITTKTNSDDPLETLLTLVKFSKKHPDKFDWKKNLNEWHILFVDHIVQLARNIPDLKLTPKQHEKAIECVERMTLV
jgi:hypothetical protein